MHVGEWSRKAPRFLRKNAIYPFLRRRNPGERQVWERVRNPVCMTL